MIVMRTGALTLAMFLAAGNAWAQTAYGGDSSVRAAFRTLADRLEQVLSNLPALGSYFARLPQHFDFATAALLLGIVVAGLAAEQAVRLLLAPVRQRVFHRHGATAPLRAFFRAALLDGLALLALWIVARLVAGQVGQPPSMPAVIAHQTLMGLLYWRGFNFVFRIWLRPNTPKGRIAPVDDATASRLLLALNIVVVLPVIARHIVMFMAATAASAEAIAVMVLLYVPLIAAGLLGTVWRWRYDMAAWLTGMVDGKSAFPALKLALAADWWVGGLAFYFLVSLAAIVAALTERATAMQGLSTVESLLLLLLLLETLIHRLTRHLPMEAPTVGDVVAGCLRLVLRLVAVVIAAEAIAVNVLAAVRPLDWLVHDHALKEAALSTIAAYALWRFLKYRMDRYIADNPLPTAGFGGEAEDDAPAAASRLRTIMPVLKVAVGIAVLVLGALLVLSQLGVNITPLIAGASVLGLAVSFGSQSLVRDVVSGVFFLAEDSFRVGEYIDVSRVKGTVEGFSVRSIRLRHQNGQLHIVPFGQISHITNFSRDWTTVKFNLAFGLGTDIETLPKAVKKIGLEMMAEPQYQKELIQPLKMQGIVDIKDAALIVRFKFTAKPVNPSIIQRIAIRRMYEGLPKLGIEFARPPLAQLAGLGGPDPAARIAAQ